MAPKQLHPFQLIFSWMSAIFIDDAYFTLVSLNFEVISASERIDQLWLRVLCMYILTPMLVIWTMEGLSKVNTWFWKMFLFGIGAVLLLGVDAALNQVGVWAVPADWPAFAWISKPILLLFLVCLFALGFRHFLRREGLSS
ncbi:hypothetical protein [Paenibacillus turpanensis]|uniref:hypothetical protein n=1 Tax=Paenibacillus turpanensis TaxID=2689078 RepID=UPI00140B957D|nr:hypothetical protein [Paenibacillus turpanensis]